MYQWASPFDARRRTYLELIMQTSDAERLAALWVKAQPTVTGFIRAMVPNAEQAEEVLQETAMACVRKFDTYDPDRPFDAWAVGVARFQVFAWRRQRASQPQFFDDDMVESIADSYERISERAQSIRRALGMCLEQTSERTRQALDLYHGQGKKTDEVASQLQMTGVAVRSLLSRARVALRKCIEHRLTRGGA